jgi:hypothetical protein
VVNEHDDPRVDGLMRRLAAPLDAATTAAARERVWSRLAARRAPARGPGVLPGMAAVALAIAILVGGAWLQSYRVEVGHPGSGPSDFGPFIYREEVARSELTGPATGAIVVRQRHIDEPRRQRLSAVVEAEVHFAAGEATLEIRYREAGGATQVLVTKRADATDTGLEAVAPLPQREPGDVRTYEVWLHVDRAGDTSESAVLAIEVSERPEGQRARLVAPR